MLLTLLLFVVILALLVFVHEFGHFITAKRMGVAVEEFGFGFPPRLFGIKRGGTLYSVNLIPLGGFVRIKGEIGDHPHDENSFAHKKVWQRITILTAGVIMNFALAFVLLSIGFMLGTPQEVSDSDVVSKRVRNVQLVLVEVAEKSPAKAAGMRPGDVVVSIDGNIFTTPDALVDYIREHAESDLQIILRRGNKELVYTVRPARFEGREQPLLGIGTVRTGLVKYNFFESWIRGAQATIGLSIAVIYALVGLVADLFRGQGVSDQISGFVGVAVLTGQVAALGISYLINFTAILSVNLAILNLIPFPALDGGRVLFVALEKLKGRPVSPRIEAAFHHIGFILLITLMIFVTYQDFARYGSQILFGISTLWR